MWASENTLAYYKKTKIKQKKGFVALSLTSSEDTI